MPGLACICQQSYFFYTCIERYFSKHIWEIKIALKVLNILVSNLVQMKLKEELLCIPFMAAMGLIEGLITLSAEDFIDFLLSVSLLFLF